MSAQPNHSLIDGLACLQALASSREPIGCRELARNLNLNTMRANRLLKTLADIGLAHQDGQKRYGIGPGIHSLAAQSLFGSGLLHSALPLIKQVKHKGLTVAIGVLWRDQVTYLFHGQVGKNIEDGIGRMGMVPATRSSLGMYFLAQLSDEDLYTLYPDKKIPDFDTKTAFKKQITKIRKNNVAVLTSQTKPPHLSIAVHIGDPCVACIAFSGIDQEADVKPFIKELQSIAAQIKA